MIPLIWILDSNGSPNANTRLNLYSSSNNIPLAVFDGSSSVGGGTENTLPQYINHYNFFANNTSPLKINIQFEYLPNNISATATVELLEDIDTTNNKILFIITYDNSNINDNSYFANVVRYNEQDFEFLNQGDIGTYSTQFALNPQWDQLKLHIVVLVQPFTTNKTILQVARKRLDANLPQLMPPRRLSGEFVAAISDRHSTEDVPPSIRWRSEIAATDDGFSLLQWETPLYDNTELLRYKIYRDGIFLEDVYIPPTQNFYHDENIIPETMYYYWIQAEYTDGESRPSNIVDIYTDNTVPTPILGVPGNFEGYDTLQPDAKFLIWNTPIYENTDFIKYKLYRNGIVITEINSFTEIFYTDRSIQEVGDLIYYVTSVYTHGESKPSRTYTTNIGIVSNSDITAEKTWLGKNYPNPFNPNTFIPFYIEKNGFVSIVVYNIRGQKISVLVNHFLESGQHSITWNGLDDNDLGVTSGIYFIKMEALGETLIQRVTLIK